MNIRGLIHSYIPTEFVLEKQVQMFNTLLALLQREDIEETIRIPIVDNLFGFLTDLEHIKIAREWLDRGAILKADGTELFKLSKKHKLSIVKVVFEEPSFENEEEKQELLEKVIGDDKSDIAVNARLTCRAYKATAENKEAVWKEITDPSSELSLYQKGALMGGFYSFKQLNIIRPYFSKFIEQLPSLYKQQTFKFMEAFSGSLLPRLEVEDSYIV